MNQLEIFNLSTPWEIYSLTALLILGVNLLFLFLLKLIFPWQTRRLLRKWDIQLKSNKFLPLLRKLDILVINLSGTLTMGKPVVDEIIPIGISPSRLLTIVASVEKDSSHPIAKAILAEAAEQQLTLVENSTVNQVAGKGIEALINRQAVRVGSATFLEESKISVEASLLTKADQLACKGNLVVFVAIGDYCRGMIILVDKLKRTSFSSVAFLQAAGINCVLLTSTVRSLARHYGKQVNLHTIRGGLNALEKAQALLELKGRYATTGAVALTMRGESVLHTADIGIAMSHSEPAVKAMADLIIHNQDIGCLATGVDICHTAQDKRRTSIILISLYNLLMIITAVFFTSWDPVPQLAIWTLLILSVFTGISLLLNQLSLKY